MARKHPNVAGLGVRIAESALAPRQDHPVRHIIADEGLLYIPVEALRPNPNQPRQHFDETSLQEMTDSVREKGILQPVIAHKDPDGAGYILIAGERRWRAAKAAGLSMIPALVRGQEDSLEIAIIENLQRENLNPIEEAEALAHLKEARGFTDELLAKVVGKARPTITETLWLTKLPTDIKTECRLGWTSNNISKSQLLSLIRAGAPEKVRALWEAMKRGEVSTVRTIRERSKGHIGHPKHYRFYHKPKGHPFQVLVTFSKPHARPAEIKNALRDAIKHVPNQ